MYALNNYHKQTISKTAISCSVGLKREEIKRLKLFHGLIYELASMEEGSAVCPLTCPYEI